MYPKQSSSMTMHLGNILVSNSDCLITQSQESLLCFWQSSIERASLN